MTLSRVSSKGQVVIPKPLREKLGLAPGSRLKVTTEDGRLILTPFIEPPKELLVEASGEAVSRHLSDAREQDEGKIRALLQAIGIKA